MMGTMKRSLSGFTLIEMSIVVVIIGLLAGGIMAGQSLVRASRVGSVIVDVNRVRQSVQIFRQKYNALPGDFSGATVVWGEVSAACTDSAATSALTCNGNGDGKIGAITSTAVPATSYEIPRAWQHLNNAGLADGTFSGAPSLSTAPRSNRVGVNAPATRFEEATMVMASVSTNPATDAIFFNAYEDVIMFGRFTPDGNTWPLYALLLPSEAESIDLKTDDGRPGTGSLKSLRNGSSYTANCATTAVVDTAEYTVGTQASNKVCSLVFSLQDNKS